APGTHPPDITLLLRLTIADRRVVFAPQRPRVTMAAGWPRLALGRKTSGSRLRDSPGLSDERPYKGRRIRRLRRGLCAGSTAHLVIEHDWCAWGLPCRSTRCRYPGRCVRWPSVW